MRNKNVVMSSILFIAALLVIVPILTYAWFSTQMTGTSGVANITTTNLAIDYSDSSEINEPSISPGWSKEKTFTVTNNSTMAVKYDIYFHNLINTFVTNLLTYTITSTDGGTSKLQTVVPKSSTASDQNMITGINIASNTTHTYKIIFNYENSQTVNQEEDKGKTFTGSIEIKGTGNISAQ